MSTLKGVQRYGLVGEYDCYISDLVDGDYVLFEDVEELISKEQERKAALTTCIDTILDLADTEEDEYPVLDRSTKDKEDCVCIGDIKKFRELL